MSSKFNLAGGVAAGALLVLTAGHGHAQTSRASTQQLENQIQQLQQNYQNQIQGLQAQLDQLKEQQRQQSEQAEVVRNQAAQASAAVKQATSGGLRSTYHIGGVTLKVGGFVEAATIYRSSNETADVGSVLGSNKSGGIPFNFPYFGAGNTGVNNYGLSEFRESARQSRLSLEATGKPDDVTTLTAYWENDFLGQGGTANSNESNSYNLRMRHAFALYDRSDWGFELLGGQTWSLATLDAHGLDPFKVVTPLSIDAQYNVGFNWMRQPQIRLVENFMPGWWGAVSFENPQMNNPYGTPAYTVAKEAGSGGGLLSDSNTSFSFDGMPDIIAKVAAEPGWGHYEIYGLARQFRSENVSGPGIAALPATASLGQQSAFGGGIGFGAVLPVVPKLLDVTVSGLYGSGIGKYASGQLPDVTFNPSTGAIAPIREIEAMVGVVGHPTSSIDLYGYWGIEHEDGKTFGNSPATAGGYGSPLFNNTQCAFGNNSATTKPVLAATVNGTCDVDTLWQAQIGAWWNFYKGEYGRMAVGASYSYVNVGTFDGIGGAPSTHENIFMTSFRYYPF